jgi:hypothetical protein
LIGGGVLAIWFDVDPADRPQLEEWYPQQHLPERLGVPGFLRGRRYAASGDGPAFFTLYETHDATVLSSPAYLARLNNPTEWTRHVLPTFRRMARNAYRLIGTGPADALAPHLLTARIKPDSGRGPTVNDWLQGEAVRVVGALYGVAACGVYVSETAGTGVATEERKLVGGEVVPATPFLALCEITDARAEPTLREFWQAWGRRVAAEVTVDVYRLLYGLSWL